MPTPHVTLHEALSALGGPLEEKTLWALLYQGTRAISEQGKGLNGGPSLLITPETVLLHPGGSVHLLPGIQEHSSFTAPELFSEEAAVMAPEAMEKSYVYSFGMTLFTAMENGLECDKAPLVSDQLHSVLLGMIEDSQEQRLSLEQVSTVCQKHIGEAEEEVDQLVTYVLGTNVDLSSSEYGDLDMDDANLESELHEAMQMHPTGSVEHLHSPSYGSRTGSSLSLTSRGSSFRGSGNLQRKASFRSVGHAGSRENLAALPPLYYSGGSQDGLNSMEGRRQPRWASHDRLSLHIQPQELAILAAKGRGSGRQLPPEPTALTHLCTPGRSRKLGGVAVPRKPQHVDIRRSASFTSEYRPRSGAAPLGVELEFLRTKWVSESDQDSDTRILSQRPPSTPSPGTPPPDSLPPSTPPPSTPPPSIPSPGTPPPGTPPPDSLPPSTPPPSTPPPSTPPPSTPPPSASPPSTSPPRTPPPSTPPPSTPPPSTPPPSTPPPSSPPPSTPPPSTPPPDEAVSYLLVTEEQAEVHIAGSLQTSPADLAEGVGLAWLPGQQPSPHGGQEQAEGLADVAMESAEMIKEQPVVEVAELCENALTLNLTVDDMPSLPPRMEPDRSPPRTEGELRLPISDETDQGLPSLDKIDSILQSVRRRSSSLSDLLELPQASPVKASSLPNVTDTVLTEGPVTEEQFLDPNAATQLEHPAPGTLATPQRPPPLPQSQPPMFTPYKPMEGHDASTGSPPHNSSHDTMFDYSGIAEPATAESRVEDDFEFLAPDCPPPVPPPLDDSAQLTPPSSPPPLPVSSPPGLDLSLAEEAAVVAPSEVRESAVVAPSEVRESAVVAPSEVLESAVVAPSEVRESAVVAPSEVLESAVVAPSEVRESAVVAPSEVRESAVVAPSEVRESAVVAPSEVRESAVVAPSEVRESAVVAPSEVLESAVVAPSEVRESAVVAPSEVRESAVVAPSEVLESAPTEEMFTKLLDDESLILGSTSRRGRKFDKKMTPRRALDEAFEQLDTDGPDDAYSSEEELDPAYSTVHPHLASEKRGPATVGGASSVVSPAGSEVTPPGESELYAKVNKPHRAAEAKTWPRAFAEDQAYAMVEVPDKVDMPVYATVDKSRKTRRTVGLASEEVGKRRWEVVPKAASVDNVYDVQYAEVDIPKRSSMIEHHYHSVTTQLTTPPAPPSPPAGAFEVTFEDDWGRLQENETSLLKLEKMFGPEFAHLSNRAKQEPDSKRLGKMLPGQVPEGRRLVRVVLLSGRSANFLVEHDSNCRELFQQVVSYQSLGEQHVFGLAVVRDRDEWFLDFDRKLAKYAPSGWATTPVPSKPSTPGFTVFFRVKFYVENVSMLRLSQTRHQYYLQLRKDILEGKTYCHELPAMQLAAFALQAERGDHASLSAQHNYFRPEDYLPRRVISKLSQQYVCEVLPDMHAEQQGLRREEAELAFLKEAQKLPEYGMVFYRVANEKHKAIGTVWLGFCVRGIVAYDVHKEVKTPIHHCSWRKIQNLSFANRKLLVELQGTEQPLVFHTGSYKKARYLLHLSISYHRFQLYTRGLLPPESLSASTHQQVTVATETSDQQTPSSPKKGSFGLSRQAPVDMEEKSVSEIRLLKEPVKGLGIRIVDQPGPEGSSVIVIDDIIKEGPAHMDGKLKKGDVLLSVNGRSLKGLSHREAAEVLRDAPSVVTLTVLASGRTEGQSTTPPPLPLFPLVTRQEEIQVVMEQEPSPATPPQAFQATPSQPSSATPPQPSHPSTAITTPTTLERESRPTAAYSPTPLSPTPMEWLTVHLQRGDNGSFGFAIAGSSKDSSAGVVVLKVTAGGAADGRLQVGDRFLSINSELIGVLGYSEALSLIQSSGVSLEIELQRRASPASNMHIDNLPRGHSFLVELHKQAGALGLRVAGGKDKLTGAGFIRINHLNKGFPAADCGRLKKGDIVLQVNDETLVGVTHRQAAEILLSPVERVCLHIHRPSDPSWASQYSLPASPSMDEGGPSVDEGGPSVDEGGPSMDEGGPSMDEGGPSVDEGGPSMDEGGPREESLPVQEPESVTEESLDLPLQAPLELAEEGGSLNPLAAEAESGEGLSGAGVEGVAGGGAKEELETITLKKGLKGFGFKIDDSRFDQKGCGLYVLSVDDNPAKSDGRLRPGDEVIEVNGVSLVDQLRRQAVQLLKSVKQEGILIIRRNHKEKVTEEVTEEVKAEVTEYVTEELSEASTTAVPTKPASPSEPAQETPMGTPRSARAIFHIPPPPATAPPPSPLPTTPPPSPPPTTPPPSPPPSTPPPSPPPSTPPPSPPPLPHSEQPQFEYQSELAEAEVLKPASAEPESLEPGTLEPTSEFVESRSVEPERVSPEPDRAVESDILTEVLLKPTTPRDKEKADSEHLDEEIDELPPLPSTPLPDDEQPLPDEDPPLPDDEQPLPDEDPPLSYEDSSLPDEDPSLPDEDPSLPDEDPPLSDEDPSLPDEDPSLPDEDPPLRSPPPVAAEEPEVPPPPTSPLPDEPQDTGSGELTEERVSNISLEMRAQRDEAPSLSSTPPPPGNRPNNGEPQARLERSSSEESEPLISTYLPGPHEATEMEPQRARPRYSHNPLASLTSLEDSLKFTNSEELLGPPQHV